MLRVVWQVLWMKVKYFAVRQTTIVEGKKRFAKVWLIDSTTT